MNIFDLRGPEFLEFFAVLLAGGTAAALALRWGLRGPGNATHLIGDLDPYEAAYLTGGPRMAVNAALAGLVHSGSLAVLSSGKVHSAAPLLGRRARIEHDVYELVVNSHNINGLHPAADRLTDAIASKLRAGSLALVPGQKVSAPWMPALLMAMVFAVGAEKIAIGISRGRPVGFLVLLCMLTAVIAICFAATPVYRTRAGDRLVKRARGENSALHSAVLNAPQRLAHSDFALALALFGPAVLASGPLASLRDTLWPSKRGWGWSGWDSCASSCGGGSCGGGGCGGGGCGGCGGGGA